MPCGPLRVHRQARWSGGGGGLELSAPGVQDTDETRESGPEEARVCGEPFERCCRRLQQGLVREAWLRAQKGTQGLRDREGEEDVWPRELCVQVVR